MEGALRTVGEVQRRRRLRRPGMPWGPLAGLEVVVLAVLSAWLVLAVIPAAFDVEWGCMSGSGKMRTAADTYIGVFAVGGALGWLAVAGITALACTTNRRWLPLAVPAAWFGLIVLVALAVAASIGPLPC